MSAVPAKMSPSALRTSGWSSAMRTLIMRAPAVSRPPATGCRWGSSGCDTVPAESARRRGVHWTPKLWGVSASRGDPQQPARSSRTTRTRRRGHTVPRRPPRRMDRSRLPLPTDPLGRRPVAAPRPPRGGTQCTTDPRPRDAPCSGTDHRLLDLLVDLALDDRARHDEFLDPGDCPVAAPTFASAAPAGNARTPPRTTHAYSLPALAR